MVSSVVQSMYDSILKAAAQRNVPRMRQLMDDTASMEEQDLRDLCSRLGESDGGGHSRLRATVQKAATYRLGRNLC